jgi:ribonucleoside-diphosphate reductase alpha chain
VSLLLAEKPSIGTFLAEWKALYDSGSGERGLFSRAAAQRQAARNGRRDATQPFGTNPCW